MKIPRRTRILTLSTILLLSATFLVTAQTPSSANPKPNQDAEILPYLLDNANDNSVVRVRCLGQQRQELNRSRQIIRDSLLQPNLGERHQTVTIKVEGSCRNVRIRLPDDAKFSDFPVSNPYLDNNHPESNDSWLSREGSGWYWLLHRP